MGLLSNLAKLAVTAGKLAAAAGEKMEAAEGKGNGYVRPEPAPSTAQLKRQAESDGRTFDEKLKEILAGRADVRIEEHVPVDDVEMHAGKQIYTRKGNYCLPDAFSYKLSCGGKVLYIRLWDTYAYYNHAANRQVKEYCDSQGIGVLDFFNYLPNGVNYMRERILAALN
ncbi:MAG: hypothetical protein K5686_04680 [Lachnospiraceae bacterium]|nr:hypothetical protein [Lachnospiraceae bacterium]